MADGRPIKQVKFQKTQKAHLHPLSDACVKNKRDPCTGYRVLLRKRNADIRTRDGRTSEATPHRWAGDKNCIYFQMYVCKYLYLHSNVLLITCLYKMYVSVSFVSVYVFVYIHYPYMSSISEDKIVYIYMLYVPLGPPSVNKVIIINWCVVVNNYYHCIVCSQTVMPIANKTLLLQVVRNT